MIYPSKYKEQERNAKLSNCHELKDTVLEIDNATRQLEQLHKLSSNNDTQTVLFNKVGGFR